MNELLERIRGAIEGLNPRERLLVGGAGASLLVFLVVVGLVNPVIGQSSAASARRAAAERELEATRRLRQQYDELNSRLSVVEGRIRSGPKGELFTQLEDLARQAAVKIDSMEPRTAPASDDFAETKVQVSLKNVSLAQLVNYLHRIDTAPQLLTIKTLRMRTRKDQQDLLDANFTVSSFEAL